MFSTRTVKRQKRAGLALGGESPGQSAEAPTARPSASGRLRDRVRDSRSERTLL